MIDLSHIISRTGSLHAALERLNSLSGKEMTLLVVDNPENMRVVGTLTDGDVRRALLAGVTLDGKVEQAMFTGFKKLSAGVPDQIDLIREIRTNSINMVPVVDDNGCLVEIALLEGDRTRLPLSAVLMAGGVGERLRPRTLEVPKPLLEIDGKAIIDYNVEALIRAGIKDITVATRYLADKIYNHFEKPIDGVKVKCVRETKPLGTIGAVSLMEHRPGGNTLVMNSDLLTSVSFEDVYVKHRDSNADVTVCVIPYQVSVPYAILTTKGGEVTGIEEKPSFSHYANAGIYIFRNELLSTVPTDKRTDATDLICNAIRSGRKVVYHVINGTWIDIGSPTDFSHAEELMRHHRNLSGN